MVTTLHNFKIEAGLKSPPPPPPGLNKVKALALTFSAVCQGKLLVGDEKQCNKGFSIYITEQKLKFCRRFGGEKFWSLTWAVLS